MSSSSCRLDCERSSFTFGGPGFGSATEGTPGPFCTESKSGCSTELGDGRSPEAVEGTDGCDDEVSDPEGWDYAVVARCERPAVSCSGINVLLLRGGLVALAGKLSVPPMATAAIG